MRNTTPRALRAVLERRGQGRAPRCLLLGAALALEVAGIVKTPREGVERAAQRHRQRRARKLLDSLAAFGAASSRSGASA